MDAAKILNYYFTLNIKNIPSTAKYERARERERERKREREREREIMGK